MAHGITEKETKFYTEMRRRLVEELGMAGTPVATLAKALDMSPASIMGFLNGTTKISSYQLLLLCQTLRLEPGYLLTGRHGSVAPSLDTACVLYVNGKLYGIAENEAHAEAVKANLKARTGDILPAEVQIHHPPILRAEVD